MICARCGRPLLTAALIVGRYAFGPKCAAKFALVKPAALPHKVERRDQPELFDPPA